MPRVDGDDDIDWGRTSRDYSTHRPNYPDRFFGLLRSFDVGLVGQAILDLGTGVGFLAQRFAEQGSVVTGIDIAEGQIEEARRRCAIAGLSATFLAREAEATGLPQASFDVVTASQAWLYFDTARAMAEVKRVLKPGGLLVTCHVCWLPRQDPIARSSEQLVLQHNPRWTGADWAGHIPFTPAWSEGHFTLRGMLVFDEAIPFTRESWRGRFRACRGVGATLSDEEVESFDRAHDAQLRATVGETFSVLHRVDAHVMRPIDERDSNAGGLRLEPTWLR